MIRAVSFDVWNTLINSNLTFSDERTKLICSMSGLEYNVVRSTFKNLKGWLDDQSERCGVGYNSAEIYEMLLKELHQLGSSPLDWVLLRAEIERLFILHPPTIGTDVAGVLQTLDDKGLITGIGSNTNFVSGRIMLDFLESRLGWKFNFSVFSDIEEVAKPDQTFFKMISRRSVTAPQQILHVGDNLICDGGCVKEKFHFLHVEGPHQIKKVLEAI